MCVGSESGYASSELDVSRDLWALLQGFYNKYPALANNKLYVFGERSGHIGIHIIHAKDWFEPVSEMCMSLCMWCSYGGHYAPELSAYILTQNKRIQSQVRRTHTPAPSVA